VRVERRITAVAGVDAGNAAQELDRLAVRLHPGRNRGEVLARLNEIFRSGEAPDPWPSGFQSGRLVATSTWGPWDSLVQRIAGLWTPWSGKSFDEPAKTGINRFRQTAAMRWWLRLLFPGYRLPLVVPDWIEAFPFRNAIGPGELDLDLEVLKIDYDFAANPGLIRRILDELVQVAPGLYLGAILFRLGGRYHRIGFFSLRA